MNENEIVLMADHTNNISCYELVKQGEFLFPKEVVRYNELDEIKIIKNKNLIISDDEIKFELKKIRLKKFKLIRKYIKKNCINNFKINTTCLPAKEFLKNLKALEKEEHEIFNLHIDN